MREIQAEKSMKWHKPIKYLGTSVFTALILVILISACSGGPDQSQVVDKISTSRNDDKNNESSGIDSKNPVVSASWKPLPEDENLIREQVFIDSTEILILESYPPQFVLKMKGSLPTPCNELRVRIEDPDRENRIEIEVYSVIDPEKICVQVLEEFDENIPLITPPPGYYDVFVNGEQIGEIGYE
jgi:hypothetical protein